MGQRWIRGALPAVMIHICIGSVYAWSVVTKPIMQTMGVSLTAVQWTFSIAIFILGMSAALLGSFAEKKGPKTAARISAGCFGVGLLGTGLAIRLGSVPLLYFFYGVVGGVGLGVGYIAPVKTLVKWFYDRKGVATGISVMGFGFAGTIAGPLFNYLFGIIGVSKTFFVMGIVYMAVMFAASQLIQPPPESYGAQAASGAQPRQFTVGQAVRTKEFYLLWAMLFINITAGISLISVTSPFLQDEVALLPAAAAAVVGLMALFNGVGRIFWASLSDYLGRPLVYTGFFLLQIFCFVCMYFSRSAIVLEVLLCVIVTCYGGGFSCIPAYLSDVFGNLNISAILGRVLTAWAVAGLAGPAFTAFTYGATGSYNGVLLVLAGLLTVGVVPAWVMMGLMKKR